jgi:hypothetical protein
MIGQSIVVVGSLALLAIGLAALIHAVVGAIADREWPVVALGLLMFTVLCGAVLAAFGI